MCEMWGSSMQVQTIGNTNSSIKFQSKTSAKDGEAVSFVDLNDRQLKNLAYSINNNKDGQPKKKRHPLLTTFLAMPVVDTIASGVLVSKISVLPKEQAEILRNAPLSVRTFCAAKTAANWCGGLAILGLYNVAKKAIASKSPGIQKFEQDHPVANFLTDMALITGAFFLALKGSRSQLTKYFAKHPEKELNLNNKLVNMANRLDNTNFNNKVLPKMAGRASQFAEKAPFLAKAGRFTLANSIWILLAGSILHNGGRTRKDDANVEQTYQKLKTAQAEAKQRIS